MKPVIYRFSAVFAAAVTAITLVAAVPAGAAQASAPPPQGLPALLELLLGALRGVAPVTPASPAPPAATTPSAPAATTFTPSQEPTPVASPASPLAVEGHLAALRYDVGAVDGNIDEIASSAIMAFQKVTGGARTGVLTDAVAAQIMATSGVPTPLVPNSDVNKVEIDLTRQVLFLYEGGSLSKILPVSSGTAATPTGSYRVYRQARGWETSYLGRLYNSQYIVGGYAVHGSLSVPNYPASHGCVRIPMSAAEWFPDHVSIGTPVYVLGG
jgi:lipoprotein-anchoring transpeptidase ErfK/SrfK